MRRRFIWTSSLFDSTLTHSLYGFYPGVAREQIHEKIVAKIIHFRQYSHNERLWVLYCAVRVYYPLPGKWFPSYDDCRNCDRSLDPLHHSWRRVLSHSAFSRMVPPCLTTRIPTQRPCERGPAKQILKNSWTDYAIQKQCKVENEEFRMKCIWNIICNMLP